VLRAKLALREGKNGEALKLLTSVIEKASVHGPNSIPQVDFSVNEFPRGKSTHAQTLGRFGWGAARFMMRTSFVYGRGAHRRRGIHRRWYPDDRRVEEVPGGGIANVGEESARTGKNGDEKMKSEPEPAEEARTAGCAAGDTEGRMAGGLYDRRPTFAEILASRALPRRTLREARPYLEEPGPSIFLDGYLPAHEKAHKKGIAR
jgi:hypothetical protein